MTSPHDLRPVRTSHSISFSIIIHPAEMNLQWLCTSITSAHSIPVLLQPGNTSSGFFEWVQIPSVPRKPVHTPCVLVTTSAKLFQPIRMTSTHIFCPAVDKNLNILAAWLWPCAEHTLLHQQENPFFSQRCSWMQEGWGVKKKKKMPQRWLCQKLNNFGSHKSKIDHGCLKDNAGRESWQPLQNKTCFSTTVSSSLPGWAAAAAAAA